MDLAKTTSILASIACLCICPKTVPSRVYGLAAYRYNLLIDLRQFATGIFPLNQDMFA